MSSVGGSPKPNTAGPRRSSAAASLSALHEQNSPSSLQPVQRASPRSVALGPRGPRARTWTHREDPSAQPQSQLEVANTPLDVAKCRGNGHIEDSSPTL